MDRFVAETTHLLEIEARRVEKARERRTALLDIYLECMNKLLEHKREAEASLNQKASSFVERQTDCLYNLRFVAPLPGLVITTANLIHISKKTLETQGDLMDKMSEMSFKKKYKRACKVVFSQPSCLCPLTLFLV